MLTRTFKSFRLPIGLSCGLVALASCSSVGNTEAENVTASTAAVEAEVQVEAATEATSNGDTLAAIEAAFAAAEATTGSGLPELWTLSDEDTTIHMFGTVHVLRPETQWRSDEFEAAFAAADTLVLEADTDSPDAQTELQTLIGRYGVFTDGTNLFDALDDDEEAIVGAAAESLGVPLTSLGAFKPWFVSLNLSLIHLQASGYDPTSGVESVLSSEAKAAAKTFAYLETAEDQIKAIASPSLEDQVDALVFGAEILPLATKQLDSLVSEWADGDVAGLNAIVADPVVIGGEEQYQTLLVNRNRNWVPQITAMLDEPGTVFIAVGAAHLAGPDSVVAMLRADGYEVDGP